MKIAELFVALGFQVEGGDTLPQIEKGLDSAASKASKLALGIDVVTAGFLFMMNSAVNAAVGLSKFSLSTGLSTTELQQWQHTAAVANVSASDLQRTVVGLQEVGSRIMLGGGAAAQPWLLLGLNPNMDPFEMLKQLHAALQNLTPERLAAARVIAEQAGISSDMFQMLRQKNLPIEALQTQYLLLGTNQQKLMDLNQEWNTLKDNTTRVKNVFSAEMAPGLTKVIDLLLKGVDALAQFVHWLNGGSQAADVVRNVLQGLGIIIAVLGTVVTTFAVVVKTLSLALGGLELAALPIVGTMMTIAGSVGAVTFAIYELIKATQAFQSMQEARALEKSTGKTATEAERRLAQARRDRGIAPKTERDKQLDAQLDEKPDRWGNYGRSRSRKIPDNAPHTPPILGNEVPPAEIMGHERPGSVTHNSTTTVQIDKISVEGSSDPQATVKAFRDKLAGVLTATGVNAPAKSY